MRKVIIGMQMSLDGYVEGPNGTMDWFPITPESWSEVNAVLKTVDTVLLGRVTFQGFEQYWPAAGKSPSATPDDIAYSRFIEKVPKIVFSRTLEKAGWTNARLAKGGIAEEVARLKAQPGGNLHLTGGIGIIRAFMSHNLIDEYRFFISPVVLGGGRRLTDHMPSRIPLKLIETRPMRSGSVLVAYEPDRK